MHLFVQSIIDYCLLHDFKTGDIRYERARKRTHTFTKTYMSAVAMAEDPRT